MATYILMVYLAPLTIPRMSLLYLITMAAIVTILVIGTVNHPNMAMTRLELMESKKVARYAVVLESILIAASIWLNIQRLYTAYMCLAVILCALLLGLAKLLKQEVRGNEEK